MLICLLLLYVIIFKPSSAKADKDLLNFKTSATICDCGLRLIDTGRVASVQIFTRNGTFTANHLEYRSLEHLILKLCNPQFFNRCQFRSCRMGFFYGFKTKSSGKDDKSKCLMLYDDDALEQGYFFTFRKTGYVILLFLIFDEPKVTFQICCGIPL